MVPYTVIFTDFVKSQNLIDTTEIILNEKKPRNKINTQFYRKPNEHSKIHLKISNTLYDSVSFDILALKQTN